MDAYLLHIFSANFLLIFIDASIGYHAAPTLVRLREADEADKDWAIRGMRKLLAAVVALYMFFNCLVYFDRKPLLLLVVTGVIVFDIAAQLLLCGKMRDQKEP